MCSNLISNLALLSERSDSRHASLRNERLPRRHQQIKCKCTWGLAGARTRLDHVRESKLAALKFRHSKSPLWSEGDTHLFFFFKCTCFSTLREKSVQLAEVLARCMWILNCNKRGGGLKVQIKPVKVSYRKQKMLHRKE